MKFPRNIILLAFFTYVHPLFAGTNDLASDLLTYHLKTTVEAYDRVGNKNPKWDGQAKMCLREFAEFLSTTNRRAAMADQLYTNLMTLQAVKCDDPLLRYLHTRFVLNANQSTADLLGVYTQIASAFDQSDYPAIRKFYAKIWVYRAAAQANSPNANNLLEKATPLAAEALQDKSMPESTAEALCREIMSAPWWPEPTRWNCYRILEPALTNNWRNASFAELAKGRAYLSYGWTARGSGYANTVSEQGWKLLAERLEIARKALERAWELNPKDPDICLEMIHVVLGQGGKRESLEKWFQRGIKLNPSSWDLFYEKLEYLRPRWHGSIAQMLEFGRQCMTNNACSGSVRLGVVYAHYEVAREMPDKKSMYAYLARTNVWSEIRSNFEYFFKLYPDEVSYRHNYAQYAQYAGDWDEFLRQVKMFPSTNFAYFGGVERFNRYLADAAQHTHSK